MGNKGVKGVTCSVHKPGAQPPQKEPGPGLFSPQDPGNGLREEPAETPSHQQRLEHIVRRAAVQDKVRPQFLLQFLPQFLLQFLPPFLPQSLPPLLPQSLPPFLLQSLPQFPLPGLPDTPWLHWNLVFQSSFL